MWQEEDAGSGEAQGRQGSPTVSSRAQFLEPSQKASGLARPGPEPHRGMTGV
jgi:hypothetical protein